MSIHPALTQLALTMCPGIDTNDNVTSLDQYEQDLNKQGMFQTFQSWALRNYGDSGKTKTVTKRKYERIIKILKGEEQSTAENSKFRFWVKAKGFRIGCETDLTDRRDGVHLFVPTRVPSECGPMESARGLKKVAIVEDFFDIIYNVHVEMDGRAGKHAGQKRTYRAIAETYAFLPREAVTRFLMSCSDCQKRMHLTTEMFNNNNTKCLTPTPEDPPEIDFGLPITQTYLNHMSKANFRDKECLKDTLFPEKDKHIALVISPLKSLMSDQVNIWTKAGVSAAAIHADMKKTTIQEIQNGEFDLLFSSPESILLPTWWGMLKKFRHRICLIALDEVHCLTKWGDSFRPEYRNVSRIRSLLTSTPILALTATCTAPMVDEIKGVLHIQKANTKFVGVVPDRPNICLSVERTENDFLKELKWYVELLKTDGAQAPRAIIYARTVDTVWRLYGMLMDSLGDRAWVGECAIVEMFHATTDEDSKERILTNFPSVESPLRCVVATIAFGMGVQVDNIRFVLHWGPSKDILSYWQEVGRCGRDNRPGKAYMYLFPKSCDKRYISSDMLGLIQSVENGKCIRDEVLKSLTIEGMGAAVEGDKGGCCSVCLKGRK